MLQVPAQRSVAAPMPMVLRVVLAAIALVAVAVPALLVALAPRPPVALRHAPPALIAPKRVVPKAEVPEVEPVQIADLSPEDARAFNAAVPFSTLPNPAARPFHIFGSPDDRARAVDCLAAAVLYEAGDDALGERAVAQVVINRVRHPAFPKTVCGVVFQGSERSTGCQFTFSCDGALARAPSPAAWARAQDVARLALTGSVYKPVGHATHYHTDWVVPYWSSSLEKITELHTHLFFRWAGWWGTPPAFNRHYAGAEPQVALLAAYSPVHRSGEATDLLAEGLTDPATLAEANLPTPSKGDPNSFLVALDKRMNPDAFAALAIRACGERSYCKFLGWTDAKLVPATTPVPQPALEAMSFSYLRDQAQGFAKALWNCAEFKRPSPLQCMLRQPGAAVPATPHAADAPRVETFRLEPAKPGQPPVLTPLAGIRRKDAPEPSPTPTPRPTATPRAAPTPEPTPAK